MDLDARRGGQTDLAVRPVGESGANSYLERMKPTELLEQFSGALAEHASAVKGVIAAIRINEWRTLSATLWQPDLAVASEQSLPRRDEFELVAAGGAAVKAKVLGRDPGTNVAALKLERALEIPKLENAEPRAGALALAFAADGAGDVRARPGIVNTAGPEGATMAGGRIHHSPASPIELPPPAARPPS